MRSSRSVRCTRTEVSRSGHADHHSTSSDSTIEKSDKKVYRFEEKTEEIGPGGEREEVLRTEWVNPPTIRGASPSTRSVTTRAASPARTQRSRRASRSRARSRAPSMPGSFYEDRRTVIEESRSPPAPPPPFAPVPGPSSEFYESRTVIEERGPPPPPSGALVLQERDYRSDRDINAEIRALETERRALRLEREADEKRGLALRLRDNPEDDFQLVEYRERRPDREVLEVVEREKSPPRNVVRVEKDRKGRLALVRSAH